MNAQKPSDQKILQATAAIMLCLVAPTFTYASGDPVVYGITPGRLISIIAALAGLTSIIAGVLALRSSAGAGFKKRTGSLSIVIGLLSFILSLVHLANTTGGFGTGSGKAGAIVAIVFGVIGITMGGIALSRLRKNT